MTIPDFQSIMLPLLETARDGNERSMADFRDVLAGVFGLSAEEREDLLPSGTQPVFTNRVAWACIYLQRAGLLERPRRGRYRITEYVNNIDSKIILIDGRRLAELMIEHNVGVSTVASYQIKKIDSDYFIEE
jgi:restriction endonuclease Mrr